MKYEIIEVKEKLVAGIRIRTSNQDANMSKEIGQAWQRFFGEGLYSAIPNKSNDKTLGLYFDYEEEEKGAYDLMICAEIQEVSSLPSEIQTMVIPQGRYAKFIVKGHMQRAVYEFWTRLWEMKLERKFSFDYEEYQGGTDLENAEIHIYISVI